MKEPMGRLGLAFKMFFKILSNAETARRLQSAAADEPVRTIEEQKSQPAQKVVAPARSEALTLLETLQREARFIDFMKEDLSSYQDAQVGAAVREVHRGCSEVLHRCFQIESTLATEEEKPFEVTTETNPAEVRLVGNVVETRPVTGTLIHSGWRAGKCELPKWTGKAADGKILAPAEVELK